MISSTSLNAVASFLYVALCKVKQVKIKNTFPKETLFMTRGSKIQCNLTLFLESLHEQLKDRQS